MFHKIKSVTALPDYRLSVQFSEGVTKIYDVKPLFLKWDAFKVFEVYPEEFLNVHVDIGGYGIIWNDDIDLSCNELFESGKKSKHLLTDLWLLAMPLPYGDLMKAHCAKL